MRYNPHSKAVFTPGTPWRSHSGDSRNSAETVAFLAHVDGWSDDGLVAYMQRYALDSEREARFRLKLVRSPMFRSYTFTYFYGKRLLRQWLCSGDRRERFRRLLTEQLYPSLVQAWVASETGGA